MTFINADIFGNSGDKIRGKIYLHSSGEKVFSDKEGRYNYLQDSLKFSPFIKNSLNKIEYFKAILWGENERKVIDFFSYNSLLDNWKGNPDLSAWVVRDRIWRREQNISCGEGMILLGEEEKLRRNTKNIEEYLSRTLNLEKLNELFLFS